jgi:hypothetical protein
MPGHPECEDRRGAKSDRHLGGRSTTEEFTGCTDGAITIERIVQVNANQLLWVQVRADDLAVAYDVIDSIRTKGL